MRSRSRFEGRFAGYLRRSSILLACLVALPAAATAPGDQETFYLDLYRSVCTSDGATECPTAQFVEPICPVDNGTCKPDFIPGASARGMVTIIADEHTQDDRPAGAEDGDNFAYTIVVELRGTSGGDFIYADTWYAFVDPGCPVGFGNHPSGDGECLKLGQWDPVLSESSALFIGDALFVAPHDVFAALGEKLDAFALAEFGVSNGVPLITELEKKADGSVDNSGATNEQATVQRWRIRFDFAVAKP